MLHQKKLRNNMMNTIVCLLLFCVLTVHCYPRGCHGDCHRGFSDQQTDGYNYGQRNSRANGQDFANLGTYSNAASGCGYVARNDLVGNVPTNQEVWSASQAYSNVEGGFGDKTQKTGQLFSHDFSKSQPNSFPLKSAQNSEIYSSGSYEGQKSVQKAKSFGNGFFTTSGLKYNIGQQVESHGNEFESSQRNENQGKSIGIESYRKQNAANGFDHNSGNDYGSHLSKESGIGSAFGIGSSNGNMRSNYNRQDIVEHGQKHTYGTESGGSSYQAGIESKGLKADLVTGKSSDSNENLINNAHSKNQESLSSSSGASNHEDLQSTLSGALGLASQGLQTSQNQPCSSCEKSSYALSNAKSHSGSAVALSIAG